MKLASGMIQSHYNPVITVIMSVYNNDGYLPEAVESILAQTYKAFEFLIIDDASTDESPAILKFFARKDPRIICFFNHENRGLTKNLNSLLKQAKGELIARMDGDDISCPTRFAEEVQVMMNQGADLVWTNAIFVDDAAHEICERYQPSLEDTLARLTDNSRWGNYIVHPSVMFKRQIVLTLGGYDEAYQSGQDGELWSRMKERGYRFALIEKPLLKYRIASNSITMQRLGYNDINEMYAYVCLANRQRAKGWQYIRIIKNPIQKLYLLMRWLAGEDVVYFLKGFRAANYNKIQGSVKSFV